MKTPTHQLSSKASLKVIFFTAIQIFVFSLADLPQIRIFNKVPTNYSEGIKMNLVRGFSYSSKGFCDRVKYNGRINGAFIAKINERAASFQRRLNINEKCPPQPAQSYFFLRNFQKRFHGHPSMSNEIHSISKLEVEEKKKIFCEKVKSTLSFEILPRIIPDKFASKACNKCERKKPLILLLAISGGCDSIALFHSILNILDVEKKNNNRKFLLDYSECSRNKMDTINHKQPFTDEAIACEVHVAHFDHKMRGVESDNDLIFVQQLCEEYHIPFHCFEWGKDAFSEKATKFSQEFARDWRRFHMTQLVFDLTETLKDTEDEKKSGPTGLILTAHHADDSDETLLLKLLRGTHLSNLSGLEPAVQLEYQSEKRFGFGKPMLNIRKREIIEFLECQRLPWREDESNTSNKYLRNRIRNELIPLMSDIVGSDKILHKRLKNLQNQSQMLKKDLNLRSNLYLEAHSTVSEFFLPTDQSHLQLAEQEALYQWVENGMNGTNTLSFDKLQLVCNQLSAYPEKKKWTMNVGKGWNIVRIGDILELNFQKCDSDEGALKTSYEIGKKSSWFFVSDKNKESITKDHNERILLDLSSIQGLSPEEKQKNLEILSVEGNEEKTFVPAWRSGRTPIKIKEFLRGQKVPLHKRNSAHIICSKNDDSNKIIAVFVQNESDGADGEWMISSEFQIEANDDQTRVYVLFVQRT